MTLGLSYINLSGPEFIQSSTLAGGNSKRKLFNLIFTANALVLDHPRSDRNVKNWLDNVGHETILYLQSWYPWICLPGCRPLSCSEMSYSRDGFLVSSVHPLPGIPLWFALDKQISELDMQVIGYNSYLYIKTSTKERESNLCLLSWAKEMNPCWCVNVHWVAVN